MKEILRTTIRLYAEKPADREALRLLRQVREEQHLRYADAIVAAVNAHYGQARQGGFDHHQREGAAELNEHTRPKRDHHAEADSTV